MATSLISNIKNKDVAHLQSQPNFIHGVKELRKIVGERFVSTTMDDRFHYARSTLASGTIPSVIVKPNSTEEIRQITQLANELRWPIHPISSGKNWGYSDACAVSDGQVLLDLSRMNRILEVNIPLGYVVIEPGVTQGQIYEYLQKRNISLWMDATGAGPDTSIIGNTMERGFGHSPYGDRFANSCGYEVVLPDGNLIQTGFGRFKNSKVTSVYKWGVGPAIDGLFTQSNLGIITKMTFWLRPKPQEFRMAFFVLNEEEDICEFIDRLRPLRMDGTLKSVIHIGNDLRVVSMSRSYPFAEKPDGKPLSMLERRKLSRETGVAFWSGTAGFYGSKGQVKADIKKMKHALKGFKGLKTFFTLGEGQLSTLEKIASLTSFIKGGDTRVNLLGKARLAFELLKGNSPKNCVQGGLWRVRNQPEIFSSDPLDYQAGFYWISPVLPMVGEHIQHLIGLVEPIFHQYGFDLQQTLSMTTERALTSVMTISFDRKNEVESQKAKECHDAVVQALFAEGYALYRAGNHTMPKIAEASDVAYENTLKKIKQALDPNSVLSPNKYIL